MAPTRPPIHAEAILPLLRLCRQFSASIQPDFKLTHYILLNPFRSVPGKKSMGKRIKAVMDQAGVTQIDAFVDSHYHEDHFGGIDDLVKLGVPVLESYDRGRRDLVPPADQAKPTYKDYMQAVGDDAHTMK